MVRASLERSHALGHAGLRPAHARLLVFLGWEGSRVSDIARALDVSKNAIGQLVSEMEDLGYVERVADPSDGRAKIVRYTRLGMDLLADAAAIGERLDAQLRDILGDARLAEFRSALADLCTNLELGPASPASDEATQRT